MSVFQADYLLYVFVSNLTVAARALRLLVGAYALKPLKANELHPDGGQWVLCLAC